MIAMALSCKPLLIAMSRPPRSTDAGADPALLKGCNAVDTAIIFITRDLVVIGADGGLCGGDISQPHHEEGPVEEIFHAPRHPTPGRCCSTPACTDHRASGDRRRCPIRSTGRPAVHSIRAVRTSPANDATPSALHVQARRAGVLSAQ
jgi:ABC-type glutathione transport system ATPase component